jgi:virulence factor Mce-like protein
VQKQAPSLGQILIMIGFALSCFGLLLFLWLAFGGAIPFAAKGYRVEIPLREAGQLAVQADVRISGVSVGKVVSIDVKTGKSTTATIELDDKYAPLPKDSRAITRQKTLLGETYVEISPGTARKGNYIPEDGTMRTANVAPSVELDEILRTFDPKTRADFQAWMQTQAIAVNGRGRDISNSIGNLTPTAEDSTVLLNILNNQETAVRRLVSNTGVVLDALTARDGELAQLVQNSNRVFETTAQRDSDLQQIFEILPTFEQESTTTLRRLDQFAANTNPLINQLRPAVVQLSPTLRSLQSLAPDLVTFFRDLGPLIDASEEGLPATDRFLRLTEPVLAQFDPFLRQFNPGLQGLLYYLPELTAFFANSVAATQATAAVNVAGTTPAGAPEQSDSIKLHYLRTTNPINLENLALWPERPGTNRPNPYTEPGYFNTKPPNRKVFESRQCDRTTFNTILDPLNSLLNPAAPALGPMLPALNMLMGIPAGGGNVAAQPCIQQDKIPSVPLPPTQLTYYPHVLEAPIPDPDEPPFEIPSASARSAGAPIAWKRENP